MTPTEPVSHIIWLETADSTNSALRRHLEEFDNLSLSDKLSIYNEYCINYGSNEPIEYFEEDFFECYFSNKVEVARAVYFGNIQSWTDDYIRFNAYGNLESLSEFDVIDEINDYVEDIFECEDIWKDYIDSEEEE